MRTTRATILVLALAGVLVPLEGRVGATPEPVSVGTRVSVVDANREQVRLVRWAATRFESAGLGAPAVEIAFHTDVSACGGHLGYAKVGRVDVCTVLVNEMAHRNLLHEIGHIWIDQNVSQTVRERFLELRGLRAWNASTDPWDQRGYEQAAEIMAWALGTRTLTAQIPGNDPVELAGGFELLTGFSVPAPSVP
jgi:hypothetical protein